MAAPIDARIKDEAHRLVDGLAGDATWDDLIEAISVRLLIDQRLAEAAAGRVVPYEEIKRRFGLTT